MYLRLHALRLALGSQHTDVVPIRQEVAVWFPAEWRSACKTYRSISSHFQH